MDTSLEARMSWTVLEELPGTKWLCQCPCGVQQLVSKYNLQYGRTSTCLSCRASGTRWSHVYQLWLSAGKPCELKTFRRLYRVVRATIFRCKEGGHERYAGRGIAVHKPWTEDLSQFLQYLLTLPGHEDGKLELDRIDNERGYEPDNLRFISHLDNMNSRGNVQSELRKLRLSLGMSQRQVARQLGCTHRHVGNVELGLAQDSRVEELLIYLSTKGGVE